MPQRPTPSPIFESISSRGDWRISLARQEFRETICRIVTLASDEMRPSVSAQHRTLRGGAVEAASPEQPARALPSMPLHRSHVAPVLLGTLVFAALACSPSGGG